MKFTDLLIDIDGTITDTKAVEKEALISLFKKYDISYTYNDIEHYSNINENLWLDFEKGLISKQNLRVKRFEILFNDMNVSADHLQFAKEYFERYSKSAIPFNDALEALDLLSENYNLHIISNGSTDVQYYKLKKLNILHLFKNIFLSEEIGYAKPDRRFFEFVNNTIKTNKEYTLVVGDSISADIEGGLQFGYKACYIGTSESNADFCIKTLSELPSLLRSINND